MEQYINKGALVAEIEGYISNYKDIVAKTDRNDSTWIDSVSMIDAKIDVLQHLLSFLDTIEVKEMDLEEKACDAYCKVCGHYAHTTPNHICRQACDYYKNFVNYMKGE